MKKETYRTNFKISDFKIIDLSRRISAKIQVFPGDPQPSIERSESHGFRTSCISLCSHTGTHIDAPAHLVAFDTTLDMLPPQAFWGSALLADLSYLRGEIQVKDLKPLEAMLADVDFLILRTGWEEKFGSADYLADFPTLSRDAAKYALSLGICGFGVDAISVDPVYGEDTAIHRILLGSGALIIENLCRLRGLPANTPFILAALPMPLSQADGAPARVMALLENRGARQ